MNETPESEHGKALMGILIALSCSHFMNDMIQSLLPSVYPILKDSFALNFTQIGLITLTYNLTASLLQPFVGLYTDKYPKPYSLPFGMSLSLTGLLTLAFAGNFYAILIGAALVGSGSSVFHPESSRMARAASGGKHGFAQSFFQVGGNSGTAVGPLLAAYIILPHGQQSIALFSIAALIAIVVLTFVSRWYKTHHIQTGNAKQVQKMTLPKHKVVMSIGILMILIFSKYFYIASINNYYTFYLIDKFHVSVQSAQLHLFTFLGAIAIGTLAGGFLGDRFGRKRVIWGSILGVLPFSLILPHADLFWTNALSFVIGVIIASAFSAIIVYAQELIPGKPGMIAGLFFGFAFGMAGLGAALLGKLADITSIGYVYEVCAWLPILGLLTMFLPNTHKQVNAT